MDFDERVGVAIFPFDCLIRCGRTLGKERKTRLIVAKYDRAVGLWVNTAFHNSTIVSVFGGKVNDALRPLEKTEENWYTE